MRKRITFFLMVVVLAIGLGASSLAQDALKGAVGDLDKGWQNADLTMVEKAMKTFEEMAKKNPKDPLAPYYAAKAHFVTADLLDIKSVKEFDETGEGDKHIDAALDLIKASLALKEDSVDTHVLKFLVLRRKMFHVSFPRLMMYISDRRGAYNRAKELAPDNVNVLLLGAIEVEDGFPPPTPDIPIAEFEKVLSKDPKMAEAYYQIGVVWEKATQPEKSKANYEKAIQADPNHLWAKKKLKELAGGQKS